MRILFLLLALALASPGHAADTGTAPTTETTPPAIKETPSANATQAAAPGEYSCKYYTVKLPEGWQAIVPPEEQQGNINAIFATDKGGTIVTMIGGPSSGQDAESVASIFAEQFKAKKAPVASNGFYTFQYPVQNITANAWVASYDGNFMLTTIAGDLKRGQKFIRDNVKSDTWPGLIPAMP